MQHSDVGEVWPVVLVIPAVATLHLMTCLVFAVALAHAQQKKKSTGTNKKKSAAETVPTTTVTYNGMTDLATLKDGAYEGNGWYRKYNYRSVSFTKRGSTITGFTADTSGVWCIQGEFTGNVIRVSEAVNWDDEYENGRQTGRHHFTPVHDFEKTDFVQIRMAEEIATFPVRRVGWLTTHASIIARDEKWMAGCLKYFSEPRVNLEPPCEDEELRPTLPQPGQMATYIIGPTKICDVEDSANCTVQNVFDVMIATPRAIGPVKDPDASVEDCGIVVLESFKNLLKPEQYEDAVDDNPIRVDIDEDQHQVINSTMPGHVFWPGRVIRQVMVYDGNRKVGVKTTGYGRENVVKKWGVNLFSSGMVWERADGFLRQAYEEQYEDDE